MISIIWFLVGFIVGMLAMFLVIASYEEHYIVKLELKKEDEEQRKQRLLAKKKKSLKLP